MGSAGEHIPFEQLVDLAEDRIEPGLAQQIRGHLAGCARCGEDFAWIRRTIGAMREDELEDAPPEVVARAVQAFGVAPKPERASGLRRLLASLAFDSGGLSPAFGLRSGQVISRQLLFEAGEVSLDIRLTPEQGGWTVAGQLLGDCQPGSIEIAGEGGRYTAELNELCEFQVHSVPSGRYALRLRFAETEVEIPTLNVGQDDEPA